MFASLHPEARIERDRLGPVVKFIDIEIERFVADWWGTVAWQDEWLRDCLRDWAYIRKKDERPMYREIEEIYYIHGPGSAANFVWRCLRNAAISFGRLRYTQQMRLAVRIDPSAAHDDHDAVDPEDRERPPEGSGSSQDRALALAESWMSQFWADQRSSNAVECELLRLRAMQEIGIIPSAARVALAGEMCGHLSESAVNSRISRVWSRFKRWMNQPERRRAVREGHG